MPKEHKVKQGEGIDAIAFKYDLFPDAIWDHPKNQNLRKLRKDRNVLQPGDIVFIPDKEFKEVDCATGDEIHTFRRKGVPSRVVIQFLEDGEVRKGVPYVLKVTTRSGQPVPLIKGELSDQGYLDTPIPPDAKEGELILDPGEDEEIITINFDHINPHTEGLQGIKSMLNNMGYDCGDEDDEALDEWTIEAVQEFQEDYGLDVMADDAVEIDETTREKIWKVYTGEDDFKGHKDDDYEEEEEGEGEDESRESDEENVEEVN